MMKFMLFLIALVTLLVVATGALVWYLNFTTELSR